MSGAGKGRVCLGAVAGARGVKGEFKIRSFTEAPDGVAAYGPVELEDGSRLSLAVIRALGSDLVLARAPEIRSREAAAALKGSRLYVDRARLPATEEDEFYIEDLVGLSAVDEAGAALGTVSAVYNFGAGDVVELKGAPGAADVRMIAFTKENVPTVDLDAGKIVVAAAAPTEDSADAGPLVSDETGAIVSDDLAVDLAAMREEDA